MLMLSPRLASVRISEHWEIVREVPPPPELVASCWVRFETTGLRESVGLRGFGLGWVGVCGGRGRTAYCLDYACEHDGRV